MSLADSANEHPPVFVFPGQSGHWAGMGQQLMAEEPVFRAAIERCDAAVREFASWSLLERLAGEVDTIDVVQPMLFGVQVALAALWRSWGVEPGAVVGHSLGEAAAAHAAGVLGLEDAARVVCARSRLLRGLPKGAGGMAVIGMSMEAVRELLATYRGRLGVAASNGPTTTVLSGDARALAEVLETLREQDVFCRQIDVDVAGHSSHVDGVVDDLAAAVSGIVPRPATIPMYSTVTGQAVDGRELNAAYWARNLRAPALLWPAMERLCDQGGHRRFIEISPHPVLLSAIQQGLHQRDAEALCLPSLRRGEDERSVMLATLDALREARHPVIRPGHPLLGRCLRSAVHASTSFWEANLTRETLPYLGDHQVQRVVLLPTASLIELALTMAREALGPGVHELESMVLPQPLAIEEAARTVQAALTPLPGGAARVQVFSRLAAEDDWVLHAEGILRAARADAVSPAEPVPLDAIRARCPEELQGKDLYQALGERGVKYGPRFRQVERVWLGSGEALGRLAAPTPEADGNYLIHPARLDSCLQVLYAAMRKLDVWPQAAVRRVWLGEACASARWVHARLLSGEVAGSAAEGQVRLLDEDGRVCLEVSGLRLGQGGPGQGRADLADWIYEVAWERLPPPLAPAPLTGGWLVLADDIIGPALLAWFATQGRQAVLATTGVGYRQLASDRYQLDPASAGDYRRLLEELAGPGRPPLDGVVHLWTASADGTEPLSVEQLAAAQELGCRSLLHLVQALSSAEDGPVPLLRVMTRGAQPVVAGDRPVVAHATLWGLGRVIAHEHPRLRCKLVDLDPAGDSDDVAAVVAELDCREEDQVAWRGGTRYGARLMQGTLDHPDRVRPRTADGHAITLETPVPGSLEHIRLRGLARRPPGPGEIEIRVRSGGLNFADVLRALGLIADARQRPLPLGLEAAGEVVAAGPGVDRPAEGDRVVAVWDASRGGLASYVTVDARLAVPWPARLSADEAATISGALLTAYYALHELGRLAAGERVLIHSAAGGVGLAAVQFARLAGAEVLATAGTEAKRAYLRSLGVRHVMDSRSLDFAAEVLASTGGRGVDVVLNSLSGEALTRSFELLAPFGRFLELGKRDLEENRQLMLAPFRENRSFGAVDVDQLIRERPEVAGRLLQEVVGRVADGTLRPLPVTAFPVSRARDAFSHMSQARHTGKIAMSFEEPEAEVLAAASLAPVRPDATYLVTGGFGGLGLQIASRLARLGARHLVLAGRRGAPPEAAAALAALRDAGVEVLVAQVDVADEEALAAMLAAARASMPPLRGVVHGAMVLEDATVAQASWESFQRVLAPKLRGAWNLHRLLGEAQLDFFVLLSSIASLLGSPGQGNYAAGNAFMDALAHHRAADGHPATSINWGPWLEVGGAARRDLADRLAARGLAGIPSEHGLEVFERLLGQARPQVAVMPFDAAVWAGFYPSARHSGLLGLLRGDKTLHDGRRQDSMPFSTDPRKRHRDVERYLREQIARILRLPAVRIHSEGRLTSLGVDSLMAVELRNALEADLGLVVPVVRILQDPTVAELATYVDERLADDSGAAPANAAGTKELLQRIDELSEEEVDELLRELLENAPDAMDGQTPDGADRGTDHATP